MFSMSPDFRHMQGEGLIGICGKECAVDERRESQ